MRLASARRILLCLRYGIGDVVMELPVLDALRRAAPRARLTVLGSAPAVELLEGDARADEVVSHARWGLGHRWDEGTPAGRAAFGRWLEERGFDLCLDAHHAPPAIATEIRDRGIRSLESDEDAERDAVAAGCDAMAAIRASVRAGWGLDGPPGRAPRLEITTAERRRAAELLSAAGDPEPAPIAISPVASLPMKRWPAARFAAVADRLIEETGRRVLLLAGPNTDVADAVTRPMTHARAVIRVGPLHLRVLAAVLARCALLVGNDTGLLHLAAAVGTPVVGIFGPTVPEIYRPPVRNAIALVGADIACPHRNTASLHPPGCWSASHCLIAEWSCVTKVGTARVVAAARRALEASATPPALTRATRAARPR